MAKSKLVGLGIQIKSNHIQFPHHLIKQLNLLSRTGQDLSVQCKIHQPYVKEDFVALVCLEKAKQVYVENYE